MDLSMKKPAASSEHKTETVQSLSSSLTASLTAPPPEMMLMFPQEFHQQTAALRDLSFGLGAGMMPMFDSGMFIPPPPGFAASSPIVAKTRGRGRRGRGRLRGRGVMATEGVEKGVAMGGVRRGGRGRGGRGSRSRAAEMMKTLTEKYLQVGSVVVMVVSVYLGCRPVKPLVPDGRLPHLVAISRPPTWDAKSPIFHASSRFFLLQNFF